ncbi:hypothetical protein AgCh_040221 [Apium graveolens]
MGVYTFVCRSSGGEWTGKQHKEGDLEASAPSTYGGVQSSFSFVRPNSPVFKRKLGPLSFRSAPAVHMTHVKH